MVSIFIIFDAPLGRLHSETGQFIDFMLHLSVPLDVSLCRRLLRDFANQNLAKDILEELEFYLNESRPLYFDEKLKLTADFVVNGLLSPENELEVVMNYLREKIFNQN